MVLILTLVFTGILILLAASMSHSARSNLDGSRDVRAALRAEMASEAGLEFARRQLSIDPAWPGTEGQQIAFANTGSFEVLFKDSVMVDTGSTDVYLTVTGRSGDAVHRFSSVIRVTPVPQAPYEYAMMVLGENFAMSQGMVYGDVLFADLAHRVNDWMFDSNGEGYYVEGHGPTDDGAKKFSGTGVDGTVFKYRNDLPEYQWLGKETVIEENTWMPSWELDEFLVPGPGKVILENPHNLGNEVWRINNLRYEETVVVVLSNRQTITLTNCEFRGGMVVICPEDYDVRAGARNLVHLKKGTVIGGGTGGVDVNIGLVAPGGLIKTDNDPVSLNGFTLVNAVDIVRNSSITGQFVILNDSKSIEDTTIAHDPAVTGNLPWWITYGPGVTLTQVVSVYEDFN
jgi:hypothetical protein